MPKLKEGQLPAYRLHKQSGQAIVTFNCRDFLLGKYGSLRRGRIEERFGGWNKYLV